MCEEMRLTHLQQTLRSLCFKSQWKYAVFWKLKHRTRMMLTWEDAYYANNDHPAQMPFSDGYHLQDPLGLAVAKMSYLVYSLGEGIIGQVAVTGKHQWIFADKLTSRYLSSSEYCDGWQTQFSAGIKTIAVVPVAPHGVVQLGSLDTVTEDTKLVTYIKDVFYSLQGSTISIAKSVPYTANSAPCLSEVSAKTSASEVFTDCQLGSDVLPTSHGKTDIPSFIPSPGISNVRLGDIFTLSGTEQNKSVEVLKEHVGFESTRLRDCGSLYFHAKSLIVNSEQKKQVLKESNIERAEEVNSGWRKMPDDSMINNPTVPYHYSSENAKLDDFILPLDEFVNYPFLPSRTPGPAVRKEIKLDRVAHLQEKQTTESEDSCTDTVSNSVRFSSGCELLEALGPSFKKHEESHSWRELARTEPEIIEPLENSMFTTEYGSDYLLEAVVANSCTLSGNAKGENSYCKSAESILTTGKTPSMPNHVKHDSVLATGSIIHSATSVEDIHKNLKLIWDSSEVYNKNESSSKTPSTSSKHSEIQTEPTKGNKKRARPGESCRPRPRDRQLIQDRVKELRELVPNGSKCSIDSLLERTIKHMFFLQSVSKHAEKLRKCAESKCGDRKMSTLGSYIHEHGSSWALDVGGQAELCPLVVENLNLDGQMLVEMLCEECSRFLEIAEAIRSLGLTILKGATEARGENVWACFVVEGNSNKGMHRMDVLWSLMQLLQPKNAIS
ncbi:hypothetical protein ACHQM5_027229 [Ranunculus cassubicifolius]